MGKGNITYAVAAILQALDHGYKYGFDIMDLTGLPSGTIYPALRRLEDSGMVKSKWEKQSIAHDEQRPPRKYYELTKDGHGMLSEAMQRYKLLAQNQPRTMTKPKHAHD